MQLYADSRCSHKLARDHRIVFSSCQRCCHRHRYYHRKNASPKKKTSTKAGRFDVSFVLGSTHVCVYFSDDNNSLNVNTKKRAVFVTIIVRKTNDEVIDADESHSVEYSGLHRYR